MFKLAHNLAILLVLLLFTNQYLVFQVLSGKTSFAQTDQDKLIQEFIPQAQGKENIRPYKWKDQEVSLQKYLTENGKQLVEMEKETKLEGDKEKLYQAMIPQIYHPCCDGPVSGCECIHAIAGRGITKYLLSLGWEEKKIWEEVLFWMKFWFPKHYALGALYLKSQGQDPFTFDAKTWLSADYSTLKAQKKFIIQ